MKKYIMNLGVILSISVLSVYLLLQTHPTIHIDTVLNDLMPQWLIVAFICMGLYWGFETLIQYLLVKRTYKGQHLWNSFKVVMTGHFFNAITPFASGGQPMQAMTMVQQGVPIGASAGILLSKFVIYQFILTLYSFVVLLLELSFFLSHISSFIYLALIGFFMNFIIVVMLLCMALMKERVKKVGFWVINGLGKLHLIKSPTLYKRNLITQVELFYQNIQDIKGNFKLLIRIITLTVLQLTAYFCVPFAVYRAFGLRGSEVFLMISAAAFIVMVSSFIPVPGGSGVAEGSFFIFFQLFFPKHILPVALLCWRILTFYVPLCFGALMTVFPNHQNKLMQRKGHLNIE